MKGAAFWNWLADGQQAPAAEGGGGGLYGIKAEDSTFGVVKANAQFMQSWVPWRPSSSHTLYICTAMSAARHSAMC